MAPDRMSALVQFDGYFASDITAYETDRIDWPAECCYQYLSIGGVQRAPRRLAEIAEVSLDIEMVISMAPESQQIHVYEGNPNP